MLGVFYSNLLMNRTILEDVDKMNKMIVEYKGKEEEKKEQLSTLEKEREAKYQELEAIKVYNFVYDFIVVCVMYRRRLSVWKKRSRIAILPSRLSRRKPSKSKLL